MYREGNGGCPRRETCFVELTFSLAGMVPSGAAKISSLVHAYASSEN